MISIKKYWDGASAGAAKAPARDEGPRVEAAPPLLNVALRAYRSALVAMGRCTTVACPAMGNGLNEEFQRLEGSLAKGVTREGLEAIETSVEAGVSSWAEGTAQHLRQKAGEIKEMLLVLAGAAEAVGARDKRCAQQLEEVTSRVSAIANLEDITEVRTSIERSATELRNSIERMTAEGHAAFEQLRAETAVFQQRLQEAENLASRDALTGALSRWAVENHIDRRIEEEALFSVAIVDLDHFKRVNDDHGHLGGDDLLRQFAGELISQCRTRGLVGRWGGDEFVIVLDCGLSEAQIAVARVMEWVCNWYTVHGASGISKIKVAASAGLAEFKPGENRESLLSRADLEMYTSKMANPQK